MAVNADPKPGRWILPLVVLGMVAFTYFFVRALPSGSEPGEDTGTTLAASDTTVPADGEESPDDTTPTTSPQVDAETQAHLDGVSGILASIQELQEEMAAVNGGFDADRAPSSTRRPSTDSPPWPRTPMASSPSSTLTPRPR